MLATGAFRGGAVTGEMLAHDLAEAGCAALVTDGLIRDRAKVQEGKMPVAAAGSIPSNGARQWQIVAHSEPVAFPGADGRTLIVHPGDIVVGDPDGIIVVPLKMADKVADFAEQLEQREVEILNLGPETSAAERAKARAERFSHISWLRAPGYTGKDKL